MANLRQGLDPAPVLVSTKTINTPDLLVVVIVRLM